MPVPASRITTSWPPSTWMHEVFPPYLAVPTPGTGMEPRTPQNLTFMRREENTGRAEFRQGSRTTITGVAASQYSIYCGREDSFDGGHPRRRRNLHGRNI